MRLEWQPLVTLGWAIAIIYTIAFWCWAYRAIAG